MSDLRTVYMVSFPKSGRTWLELIMRRITADLTELDLGALLRRDVTTHAAPEAGVPNIIFSHGVENGRLARDGIFCREKYEGEVVALLVRDPRDVLVSHYNYEKHHHKRFDGSLQEFLDFPYKDMETSDPRCRYGLEPILNTLNGWAANHLTPRALHAVHYEDLRAHSVAHAASLCDFFGVPAPREIIERAVRFASIDNMRHLEETGGLGWHGLRGSDDPRGKKVRRAVVGGHRDELSPDLLSRVNAMIDEQLSPMFDRYRTQARQGAA